MSYSLDFKKIAETPILDVATMLGFKLQEKQTDKGVQFVGCCPISQLMNPTAFKVTPSLNRFICFCAECKKQDKPGGDCIELVRRFRRLASTKEAAAEIQKHFGAGKAADNAPEKQEAPPPPKSSGFDPLKYQAGLVADHPALGGLPFSSQTIKDFGGGYASKGVHMGRLALPIYTNEGIDGFLSIPVYKGITAPAEELVRFFKGYQPPALFNAHKASEPLLLCTSILDVLKIWEAGLQDAVCPLVPMSPDFLVLLAAFMGERSIKTLDVY